MIPSYTYAQTVFIHTAVSRIVRAADVAELAKTVTFIKHDMGFSKATTTIPLLLYSQNSYFAGTFWNETRGLPLKNEPEEFRCLPLRRNDWPGVRGFDALHDDWLWRPI